MYMVLSFLGVQNQSILEKTRKSFHFAKKFRLKILILRIFKQQKPLWPETLHHNFLSAANFSVNSIEKCSRLFILKKYSLPSTKWAKLTPQTT